jgi:signal transduction histidine kinase
VKTWRLVRKTAKKTAQKTFRSTSFKLLTFFIISCLAIIFLVQSVSKLIADYSSQKTSYRYQSRTEFAKLLARDLEESPDRVKTAGRLDRDMQIGVRIEGPNGEREFATSDQITTVTEAETQGIRLLWTPNFKTGEFRHVPFSIVNLGKHRYLFQFRSVPFGELRLYWLSPLTVLIVLILFANFVLIRWLFKPVTWLSEGIHQLGEGNFDVQVPQRAYDELGDLALSFNQTVERVRGIVESKKQLLLDVSHELRSPLTRIKVALELNGPRSRDHIRKNVLVLESMIHDLLESARMESKQGGLKLEHLNFVEVLQSASSSISDGSHGVVIHRAPALDQAVIGDRKSIETCIKNVLDNALKYSKSQTKPVEVSGEKIGETILRIHVRDFGIGIAEAERKSIFEPFYRVDKARIQQTGGYGLGLNLCKKIMEAHGGQIYVESPDQGEGSDFILDFPLNPSR